MHTLEHHDAEQTHESTLEVFLRDYLETIGGAWDEIEPQVYDVLLADSVIDSVDGSNMLRLTFDPEALPEHPEAQLASFGTPLIDRLLADAVQRGRSAHFYMIGLNLNPHDLAGKLRKSLSLTEPLEMQVLRVRALHFTQAIYWFRAEFVSEQKEQIILPVALDLHYGREVRHMPELLRHERLAREPAQALPEARRLSVAAGHATARDQILRTLTALINVRGRELIETRDKHIDRLTRYYEDLRSELDEQTRRARNAQDAETRAEQRRVAIDREEQLRIAELKKKSQLRVSLRLLQLLRVDQPKLQVTATLSVPKLAPLPLELVWDPLMEVLEAPPCPMCQKPTFAFEAGRGGVGCPACVAAANLPAGKPTKRPPR